MEIDIIIDSEVDTFNRLFAERPMGMVVVIDGLSQREIGRYDPIDLPLREVCMNTLHAVEMSAEITDDDLAGPGKMPIQFRRMKDWEMSSGKRR